MPRLIQPHSLQDASMDVLVGFLTNLCDELNSDDCLDRLRQVVAFMKNEICPSIPSNLAPEFYKEFFEGYESFNDLRIYQRPHTHQRAVLEIIMDRKITGLRCEGRIIRYLDPHTAHRFQGLTLLDLSHTHHPPHLPANLENFQLRDLKTFIFREECTDTDLQVIGQNCPKLAFLDITNSRSVTSQGLTSLNLCSELRSVYISGSRVTCTVCITQFLSTHSKIEKLRAWYDNEDYGFDCFSHPDQTVYRSIDSFTVVSNRVANDRLLSVVAKFPNLISLGICGGLTGDLSVLTPLSRLSKLDFRVSSAFSWDNLKQFLVSRGENITDLRTPCTAESALCITQNDLNFLFQYCGNIELLEINYRAYFNGEKLVVPPFKKLNHFSCSIPRRYRRREVTIEFEKLLKLEFLLIYRFHITEDNIESMILDNDKFPELKIMKISRISGRRNAVDNITQFAKNHNLDFEIVAI